MSDRSACMVMPSLPLTYTQTNHVSILRTSLYVAFWQVSQYRCTLNVRCSTISLVINNSLVENFELVISNDDNNSSKESKGSNDDDTACKSAQNSLPWVLPDKYITDRLTIQLILSLLALFSLFLPSMNKSLFENPIFCFHWWLTIHQWTEFSISNSTYVHISHVKYIPLLCRIWPDFIQKSSLFYQQSLGMIQTRVPIFLNSPYSLDDKIRATVQLITYTVPQNCLSIFTIHNSQLFYLCPM